MTTRKTTIEGEVQMNIYDTKGDICSPGIYVGDESVDSVLRMDYFGKRVRITIEELPPEFED